MTRLSLDRMVDTLKAAAETSRLRILLLLSRGDLTVSDLTDILGQSQPRVSRHLKLLLEAGLIGRYQEGSWAYFRLTDDENARDFVQGLVSRVDSTDGATGRDTERLALVKHRHQQKASSYFDSNAVRWDQLRALHAPDAAVEAALKDAIGNRPFQSMLDLGTGTGRMLELFAPLYRRGVGVDMSREMLAVARVNLDRAGISNALVRQGDLSALPFERDSFDLVTVHQVLHYLPDPALAVREAARVLRHAGRLAIVDFAPHSLEFLRDEQAHLRLGFADRQIIDWLQEAGLEHVETRSFAPDAGNKAGLTVKMWIGRDRRLLIAEPSKTSLTETV